MMRKQNIKLLILLQTAAFLYLMLTIPLIQATRTLLTDGFETDLSQWESSPPAGPLTGTGTSSIDATVFHNGLQSAKLIAGNTAGERVEIHKYIAHPPDEFHYTSEFYFRLNSTNYNYLEFGIYWWNTVEQRCAAIRYDKLNNLWKYWNQTGSFVTIVSSSETLTLNAWHYVKFESDLSSKNYLRLITDSLDINMESLKMYSGASTSSAQLRYYIRTAGQLVGGTSMWVDDVNLTYEEGAAAGTQPEDSEPRVTPSWLYLLVLIAAIVIVITSGKKK